MEEKSRKIYIKELGAPVPVTEEVYHAYYRDIWRQLKREKKSGCCSCPRDKTFLCNADCLTCVFHTASETLSLDAPVSGTDGSITLADTLPDLSADIQDIAESHILKERLVEELERLDENNRLILDMFSKGATEREIAEVVGITHKAVNKRKKKLFAGLYEKLKEYK